MEENLAAAKIQALQRGRQSRVQVAKIKKEQELAATKIQALHRGRQGRFAATKKKEETPLFMRPHTYSCTEFTVIRTRLEVLRQKPATYTWNDFVGDVELEIHETRGADGAALDESTEGWLTYSTGKSPDVFANNFTEKLFNTLREYDLALKHALHLRAEHEAIEAARPPPPKVEIKLDENGEEIAPPPKSKKQLREEAERKKEDTARLKTLLEAEHRVACFDIKVRNVQGLHSLRINHTVAPS